MQVSSSGLHPSHLDTKEYNICTWSSVAAVEEYLQFSARAYRPHRGWGHVTWQLGVYKPLFSESQTNGHCVSISSELTGLSIFHGGNYWIFIHCVLTRKTFLFSAVLTKIVLMVCYNIKNAEFSQSWCGSHNRVHCQHKSYSSNQRAVPSSCT